MTTFNRSTLESAHDHALNNRMEIAESEQCGCFYCITIFDSAKIKKWMEKENTALCPHCDIDAVIGEMSGFPVKNKEFLKAMHLRWFD